MALETEVEPPNPFDTLSLAEVLGFVHKRGGETDLRHILERYVADINAGPLEDVPYYREALEDAAFELEQVGLGKAGKLVLQASDRFPPSIECNPHPADSCNGKGWLMSLAARQHHRQWQRRKRRVA